MLTALSIRDVVLIDRLDMEMPEGLGVFTGETGAGKSILLDSLSLALGARASAGLVRKGASQLSVSAAFELPADHPAWGMLADLEFTDSETDPGEPLTIRRVVTAEGRSRAYINDRPAGVGLLKQLGDCLVEIHGQFESHALLDPAAHRGVLDRFAAGLSPEDASTLGGNSGSTLTLLDGLADAPQADGHDDADAPARRLTDLRDSWAALKAAKKQRREAEEALARNRAEEDSLRHLAETLTALAPEPGEEDRLAGERALLMNGEKLLENLNAALAALSEPNPVDAALRQAMRALDRVRDLSGAGETGEEVQGILDGLDRAVVELAEAQGALERVTDGIDMDPRRLEHVEERLFSLRALARQQGVEVADLPALAERTQAALDSLSNSEDGIVALARAEDAARERYVQAARAMSRLRQQAASALDQAVSRELPPLKLDKARFVTQVSALAETDWGPDGMDDVAFLVATNPGSDPGPIQRIASGGELARFMLALKVVLAGADTVPTLVFDEVDAGIGGATAAAVGERLGRLGRSLQVLVVTHSPQVAAIGATHWKVQKTETGAGGVGTSVSALSDDQRREELARMLAGSEITLQARAAADSLLGQANR